MKYPTSNSEARLIEAVREGTAGAQTPESRFILLRDQSSSMSLVPDFPRLWNAQMEHLAELLPQARVTIYSVTARVEKVDEDISLADATPLEPVRWYAGSDGNGLLAGGSALGDAILRACQKAQQFRRKGFNGPLGIFLFTDGWSRKDRLPLSQVRTWLEHARDNLHVTFRIFGFTTPFSAHHLRSLVVELGVYPEEDRLIHSEDESELEQSSSTALERLAEEMCTTGNQRLPRSI